MTKRKTKKGLDVEPLTPQQRCDLRALPERAETPDELFQQALGAIEHARRKFAAGEARREVASLTCIAIVDAVRALGLDPEATLEGRMPRDAKVARLRGLYVFLHDKIAFGGYGVSRGGMRAWLDAVEDAIRAAWKARRSLRRA